VAATVSRTDARKAWDIPVRVTLAEQDLDTVDARQAAFEARLTKILWVLGTVAVSTTTSAILLALNLVAGGATP